jgi:hypothetical protein
MGSSVIVSDAARTLHGSLAGRYNGPSIACILSPQMTLAPQDNFLGVQFVLFAEASGQSLPGCERYLADKLSIGGSW